MKAGIQLVQKMTQEGRQIITVRQNQRSISYEIVDCWDRKEKLYINILFHGTDYRVEYVLVPEAFLSYIIPGEIFGISSNGMILVSAEIARDHPRWIPYVVSKLFLQKHVEKGSDESGRVEHYASLMVTIRVAGIKMEKEELVEFLTEMVRHERTSYYELDREVKKFLEDAKVEDSEERRKKRLKYLDRHHNNFWVRFGRQTEELDALGYDPGGFRNIAEAAYRSIDSNVAVMFQAAILVRQIAELPIGALILIPREYIRISYALTYQGSGGRVDLVRIIDTNKKGDIIKKVGHNKTWFALAKRLSWAIHQSENKVGQLIEDLRQKLNLTICLGNEKTSSIQRELVVIRNQMTENHQFDDAANKLRQLAGWQKEVTALAELSELTSVNIVELSALQEKLAEVV